MTYHGSFVVRKPSTTYHGAGTVPPYLCWNDPIEGTYNESSSRRVTPYVRPHGNVASLVLEKLPPACLAGRGDKVSEWAVKGTRRGTVLGAWRPDPHGRNERVNEGRLQPSWNKEMARLLGKLSEDLQACRTKGNKYNAATKTGHANGAAEGSAYR